jgi:hypothetical protein
MRLTILALGIALLAAGCSSYIDASSSTVNPRSMFDPVAMRIHPIFTQIKDWTGDGKPDGIEALIEFQDQFGDPTKASGRIVFELFDYRRNDPDPRGQRIVNPWIGQLATTDQQAAHWNRTSRTYSFQLASPNIAPDHYYVLTAVFDQTGGGRFFNQLIIEPAKPSTP